MSDKDLIWRGDVRKLADWFETEDGEVLAVDMDDVDDIPAVPQEMSAREYIATINRICGIYYVGCEKCPLETENNGQGKPCSILQKENPEVAIAIVEAWAREHPEERKEANNGQ